MERALARTVGKSFARASGLMHAIGSDKQPPTSN
jgi:hypothetical protein